MSFKRLSCLPVFWLVLSSLSAGAVEFLAWEELFLSGKTDYDRVIQKARSAEAERDFLMAAGLWQLAGDFLIREDPETGRLYYDKSLSLLEQSERAHQLYYTLKIGALTKRLTGRGPAAFIRGAPGIQKSLDEAMERDDSDGRTLLFWAQGKINAPRLFGGNFSKGLSVLENLSADKNETDTIRFTANILLASVWEKKGKKALSDDYRSAALSIFPQTWVSVPKN